MYLSVMHKVIYTNSLNMYMNYTMFINFQYDGPGATGDRETQQWLYHLLNM